MLGNFHVVRARALRATTLACRLTHSFLSPFAAPAFPGLSSRTEWYERLAACCALADADTLCAQLIYELLGESAEQSFTHSWGVSYGVSAAAEWKSIFKASIRAALVIAVLERVYLTTHTEWLEDSVDYFSMQSLLFNEHQLGFTGQVRAFFRFSKRCAD